jgi:DNA modification methylase
MQLTKLKFNPENPRRISPEQLDKLVRSIESLPQMMELRPIVYDPATMHVLGGNQRLAALRKMGMKEIPDNWTKSTTDMTDKEKREFVLRDNVQAGEWDYSVLDESFADFDLEDLGVELPEGYDSEPAEVTEDDFVEPDKVETDIVLGDLFSLRKNGKEIHRLLCGDATKKEDVDRLMGGAKPEIMVTDPPYGVNYDPKWRTAAGLSGLGIATGMVDNDDNADWGEAWKLSPADVAYIYHGGIKSPIVAASLTDSGYDLIALIIWNKNHIVIGRGNYQNKHEPVWYCVKKGKNHRWGGSRKESTVWDIDKNQKNETNHATQKPVECMARPLRNHECTAVYDPFIGSGTTMVAAHQLNKKSYCMEINPTYCQITLDRMRKLDPDIEVIKEG